MHRDEGKLRCGEFLMSSINRWGSKECEHPHFLMETISRNSQEEVIHPINWRRNRSNSCLIDLISQFLPHSHRFDRTSSCIDNNRPGIPIPINSEWSIHQQCQALNTNNSRMLLFNGRSSIPCHHNGCRNWPGPLIRSSKHHPKSITVRWWWRKGSSLSSTGRVCRLRTSKDLIRNLSSSRGLVYPFLLRTSSTW